MSEQIKQIAQRITDLREIYGYTQNDIAKKTNINVEDYKKYESGEVDIPVSFLYELANTLNVELTALLTGEDPKLKLYSLVKNGKGLSVERSKQYKYKNLAFNFSHKKAEIFMVTVDAESDDKPMPLNTHDGHEINYVLEGKIKIKIGDNEMILEEGDTLYYNSSTPHGMRAIGDKPAKFLSIII